MVQRQANAVWVLLVAAMVGALATVALSREPGSAADGQAAIALEERWRVEWPGIVHSIALGDVDGDGKTEILAGADEGRAYVVSGEGQVEATFHVGGPVREVAIEDLDGDGAPEVLTNGRDLKVRSGGSTMWQAPSVSDFATGGLRGDVRRYVAVAMPRAVALFDPKGKELWRQSVPGAARVAMGDLDGDGSDEVVGLGTHIHAFSLEADLLWEVAAEQEGALGVRWEGLAVEDLEGDQTCRVFATVDGGLCCYDDTGQRLWGPTNPRLLRGMLVGELGVARARVAVVGSTASDVFVLGAAGEELLSFPASGHSDAFCFADLDGDGANELIVGSGAKVCMVHAVDEAGIALWEQPVGHEVHDVVAGDVNGDGRPEVVAGADALYCFDAAGELLWSLGGGSRAKVLAADLGGDGRPEVVVGAARVEAYDGAGKRLWCNDTPYVWSMAAADFDGDERQEVFVTCAKGPVYMLDDNGAILWEAELEWRRSAGVAAELDGEEPPEVVVANALHLYAFTGDGQMLWHKPVSELGVTEGCRVCNGIHSVDAADTDGDHMAEILLGALDGMWLLEGSGQTRWVWEPEASRTVLDVEIADLEGDGKAEALGLLYGGGPVVVDSVGNLKWSSKQQFGLADLWVVRRAICASDLDGDEALEVIACGARTAAWSADGDQLWLDRGQALALTTGDLDADGSPEVITCGDAMYVLDGRRGVRRAQQSLGGGGSVVMADLDGDGVEEAIVGSNGVTVWGRAR